MHTLRETDDAAFDRVLRSYGAALGRLAAAYERDGHAREDLMQEILFALWQALPGFRGDCSERTFVYRVAHNRALTHRRRGAHRARESELDAARTIADPTANPEAHDVARRRRDRLLDAVRRLSTEHRQVILLRLEDLSNGEIAQVLGVNPNVVAIRLTRARKSLATLLEEGDVDD